MTLTPTDKESPPSNAGTPRVPAKWLLFFFLISIATAGWRPLWDPDEGRYAEVAREMFAANEWLVPTLEGEPHLTKPPLTYWLSLVGYHVFGLNEWGARFFVTVAFFLTILCVIELARTWGWTRDQALSSGLVFSTSLLPFVCGHILTTDMILTFFETAGVLCIWKVWKDPGRSGRWSLAFWAAFGFAFLTKGPPGWLPLLAIVPASRLGARPQSAGRLRWVPGLLLFVGIAFSWFAAVVISDPERARYFVVEEFYNRIFTNEHERENGWWRYPVVIAAGLFPWVFLWPEILRKTSTHVRRGWSSLNPLERFSILWFAIPFTIFLFSKSRMTLYVVPLFVPLALWAGRLLHDGYLKSFFETGVPPRRGKYAFGAYLLLLLGFFCLPFPLPGSETEKLLARSVRKELGERHQNTKYFMVEGSVYHTASFYLNSSVRELDVKARNLPKVIDELTSPGQHAVFLMKDSRFEKIEDRNIPVKVLGRSDHAIAFELLPAAAEESQEGGGSGESTNPDAGAANPSDPI